MSPDDDVLGDIEKDGRAHLPPPLDEVAHFIRRFVVVDAEAIDFLSLWVLHTWCFEAATSTPYVRVASAERASGKTRLLEVLALLTRRGWLAVNPSAAVVFRKGDSDAPTLLLDEIDQVPFADQHGLLSVLNAGYRIGIKVPRCDDKGNVHEFDVFYPKSFAGLDDGKLPDTLRSRSVPVRLERRRQDEPVERFLHRLAEPDAERLRDRMAKWAETHLEMLADAEPESPEQLEDREQEVWEPLFAIADLAGGDWPERSRAAAVTLAKTKGETDESRGVQLLTDLRRVFEERGNPEAVFSADLVASLNSIEESGWGGWNDGEGMRQRDVAKQLRRYTIGPQKIRIGEDTLRGYRREQFVDAWGRYCRRTGTSGTTGTNRDTEPPESSALEPNVPDVPDVPDFQERDHDQQDELDLGDDRDD